MANSVNPDQTASIGAVCSGSTLFASILNLSVMPGNYLQQTTSADVIFRCFFFLDTSRVNSTVSQYFEVMGQWFPPIRFLGRTRPSYFQPILAAISVTHSNGKSQTYTRLYTGAIVQIKPRKATFIFWPHRGLGGGVAK